MKVGDVPVGVGVDRIVRRVGVQLHALFKALVIARLRARVRLRERLHRILHQANRDPFAVLLADDRPVVRAIDGELLRRHAARRFVRDHDRADRYRSLLGTVLVEELVAFLHDRLEVFIDRVDTTGRVHPPRAFIEALIDEKLPPG